MTTQRSGEVRLSQGKAGSQAGSRREAAVSREPATPSPRHRSGLVWGLALGPATRASELLPLTADRGLSQFPFVWSTSLCRY